MAARKPTRKRQPTPSPWDEALNVALRPGVLGAGLILLAVFTLLSLVTDSQGSLTGAWVESLRSFVGFGVWLLPVIALGVGAWMVIRALEHAPSLPWSRPAGLMLIFLSLIIGATLLISASQRPTASSEAGGWLGLQLASLLEAAITPVGAWAFVVFILIAGVILFTERLLLDITVGLWRERQVSSRAEEPIIGRAAIKPEVPLPLGEIPWWKRLQERLSVRFRRKGAEGEPTFVIEPTSLAGQSEARTTGAPTAAPVAPAPSVRPQTPSQPIHVEPPPRIFGGAQEWKLPRLADMLNDWERRSDSDDMIRQQGRIIQDTLEQFGVPADFEGAYKGPSVTQYLIRPGYVERNIKGEQTRIKVKVAKIAALANDLALALAAPSVRIEAPIPGTNYVGVEVPNRESNVVGLKELMESETFSAMKGRLKIALGEDVKGQPVVADLARMPHLLIAGATGSGKSVCINSIIIGLLLTHTPDNLRLLLIDPKMVELSVFNEVPHLLSPVVTEVERAAQVLYWAVKEMERRYTLFSKANARDLARYNDYLAKRGEKQLPTIVIIVDEMADLMMAAPEEVEKHICRLAQMARATGIHLVIATQRPSVDVITGLIKANFPARIAFAVTSQTDSRVILDVPGAERLLGRGDMLFMAPDASKLERLQGTFLSDEEINRVVRYWKQVRVYDGGARGRDATPAAASDPLPEPASPSQGMPVDEQRPSAHMGTTQPPLFEEIQAMKAADGRDSLFDEAVKVVRQEGRGSVSLLQRRLRIGYGRASRLVEQLEAAGVLGPDQGGAQGRDVLSPDGGHVLSPDAGQNAPSPVNRDAPTSAAQQTRVWM